MMNRIYKVVWSQVKNCYTVVSEIANSHIRGGNRSRMGTAMLAVAVLTGCLGLQSTSAEAVKIQAGKNTTVVVTTDASTGDKIYTVNAADDAIVYEGEGDTKALKSTNAYNMPQGENAIALGCSALAGKEKSISIGDSSHVIGASGIAIGDTSYGAENAIGIGRKAQASGVSAVAIGDGAVAGFDNTISIGTGSITYDPDTIGIGRAAAADKKRAIALGAESHSHVEDGVALGSYSHVKAGAGVSGYDFYSGKKSVDDSAVWKSTLGSISVGNMDDPDHLKTRQITGVAAGTEDTDVVNVAQLKQVADQVKNAKMHYYSVKTTPDTDGKSESNYANDGATGNNAMAMGVYAKASGFTATAIGYHSKAIGTNSVALMGTTAHGTNAMTWGDDRNVSGAAVETKYFTDSDYGVKLPYAVTDADGFYVIATGDAAASYKNTTAFGESNIAANDEATAFGRGNLVMGSAGTAWGEGNYIDQEATLATSWGDHNYVYGHNATAWGEDNYAISSMSTTWGRNNRVSGEQGTAFGWGAEANGENATAWGYCSKAFAENATAFGDRSNAYGVNSLAVLGGSTGEVNPDVNGDPVYKGGANAMAVGKNAAAKLDDSIALGSGAVADRGKGTVGYDALGAVHDTDQSGVWKSTMNAVSVGNAAENITRQITGVAAGSEDTDAVNVAQLKQVNSKADQAVEAASKGWNISTNGVNQTKVALGDTVDFTGDSNIGVSNNGKQVKVELNKKLTGLESVTSAKAYVTSVDANDKNSVTNVDYVKSQVADASLSAGKGISITDKKIHVKLKDGEENLTVDETGLSMKKDLMGMQSISGAGGGKISFAGGNVTVNKNTFASDGRIQNVTAGMADTDAVNIAQLKQVNSKADQAVEAASKGWNISTNGVNQTKVALGDTVDFTGDSNIGVSNNGKQVKVELNKKLTGLESVTSAKAYVTSVDANDKNSVTNVDYVKSQVADASLSAGKGISITDKKIHVKLKDGEENLTVDETGLFMKKELTGMQSISGVGGGKISFAGGNVTVNQNTFASDGRIQNVTAGTADTDAVNVAQLKTAVAAGNTDTHIKAGEYSVGADNKVSMDVVDKTGKTIGAVTITDVAKASDVGNIGKIHQELQNKDGSQTTVVDAVNNLDNKVGDLKYSAVTKGDIKDGDSSTTAIGKLDKKLSDVAAVAGQHSSVSTTDTNIQMQEGTNAAGGKNYALSLNKNQQLDSVTTGDTKMDTNGITVGDKVTLTKEGLSAGDTKITNEGLSIGEKTYVTKDGLNANGNKVTHVADGKVEKDSKDAVNGGQLYNTNQMVINNANSISSLGNALGKLDHRVNKVGAGAAALAALHPLDFDPDEKWDFAAGYGNYSGASAAAIGAYYRPNEDTMFSVGGSFGNGENMVNAGVSVKLGQGNHVSTSKVAMAKEIKDLRKEVETLKSALLDVHVGRKIDTSKLQLFPDVPQNHWAYEQISILKANGVIAGYPDGKYEGERPMTRYEFATMLFRAMERGAVLSDRVLTEFAPELERFTVDTVAKDKDGHPMIERVRTVQTKRS